MASGSDDGSFSIWNLRMLKVCIDSEVKDWWLFFFSPLIKGVGGWWCWVAYTHFFLIKVEESSSLAFHDKYDIFILFQEDDAVVAHFEYHKHPITSIEWSPHESSTLAVSSSDNQLTWDILLQIY